MRSSRSEIAAVIVEPVAQRLHGSLVRRQADFGKRLRSLCTKYGALLVC
ncbi:MAG: hypothetical protein ACLTSZ_17050 [Lachnospiraceae bacterium]